MEQFKNDILYHAICLEQESDYLGNLINLAKWSIANQGAWVNEKTPSILQNDILEAIQRVKKLQVILVELSRRGYTIRGGQEYPDYEFYSSYFKKSITNARSILRKLTPYLINHKRVSERFALGELSPGY